MHDVSQILADKGHLRRVNIHLPALEIGPVDLHFQAIVVEFEHAQFGVLEDDISQLNGKIQHDAEFDQFLLTNFFLLIHIVYLSE